MSLIFDPSRDFSDVIDGLEPIVLQRPGSSASTAVAHALRRRMNEHEAEASNGRYTSLDIHWQLPKSECPAAPRPGDLIVAQGDCRFTLLEVGDATAWNCWECIARNLAIAHGLDDAIAIEQAVYGKGAGGAVAITWQTWRTGVRARIEAGPVTLENAGDICRNVKNFLVYVAEDLPLDRHYRVRAADGTIYTVIGYRGSQQIGGLPVIEGEILA
jgi:hypothetical protein